MEREGKGKRVERIEGEGKEEKGGRETGMEREGIEGVGREGKGGKENGREGHGIDGAGNAGKGEWKGTGIKKMKNTEKKEKQGEDGMG